MPIVPGFIPVSSTVVQPPVAGQYPRVQGATSGYFGLKCPSVGPSVDWTMPTADSTGSQFLQSNGSGTLSWATVSLTGLLKQTPAASADNTIQPSGLSILPLTIKQVASANSDSLQVQNSSGTVLSGVDKSGNVYINNTSYTQSNTGLEIRTTGVNGLCEIALLRSDGTTGLTITHNGQQWYTIIQNVFNSAGAFLKLLGGSGNGIQIDADGSLIFDTGMKDAKNIAVGTSTGTQIGTATTQKLGFWGATPIVQPANTTNIDDVLINTGFWASGASVAGFTKRISGPKKPRVTTVADPGGTTSTTTPNTDTADVTYESTTQSGTLTVANDTGSPVEGQFWIFKLKASTAITISWGTIYASGDGTNAVTMPTVASGSSKTDLIGFRYDSVRTKWVCVALA